MYTHIYTYAYCFLIQPAWDPVFKDLVLKKMVCWATYGNIRPACLFFESLQQFFIFAGRRCLASGLSPWPTAGRALPRPPLRVAPKGRPCGRPSAAPQAHSVAHHHPPHREAKKASIQTESEKHYSSKGGKLTTMEIDISVCRKKTRIEK